MRRREFIGILSSSLVACASLARAQKSISKKRVAIVTSYPQEGDVKPYYQAFFDELNRLGLVEGDNLVVDRRSAKSGQLAAYADLIRAVIDTSPDAILTVGGTFSLAAKAATRSIPIVTIVGDPVAMGLVSNLARPGIN
jgi:putative ABC transport system substrate-binding protein